MTLTVADHMRRVAEAERRAAEANRRAANCRAAERRAEEVANAERRAVEAEQRAAEAERHANASVVARPIIARPSLPKPITAPAPTPAQRHTPKEIPVMSTRKQALLRNLESASSRLATAKQSLEDAKYLARAGMARDTAFVTYIVTGAESEWDRACAAYMNFKD